MPENRVSVGGENGAVIQVLNDTFFDDKTLTNVDLPELGKPIIKTSSLLFSFII